MASVWILTSHLSFKPAVLPVLREKRFTFFVFYILYLVEDLLEHAFTDLTGHVEIDTRIFCPISHVAAA